MAQPLVGRRIFVVEDEALVALLIEDALIAAGGSMIGPFAQVRPALAALEAGLPDVAVLDLNLGGESSLPIAERLVALGVPILFASGYGPAGLPPRFQTRPMLAKPYDSAALIGQLVALCG